MSKQSDQMMCESVSILKLCVHGEMSYLSINKANYEYTDYSDTG